MGKLVKHNLHEIEIKDEGPKNGRGDFVFPSHKQIAYLASEIGIAVWLMRGCGLRICEALGVHKEDFTDGGTNLRLTGQASRDGRKKGPLKHRKAGEYPITDVAQWLGHKDINETYRTYGHLVPNATGRAVAALDAEYTEWSNAA